jgi:hypothetical protein
VSSRRTKHLAPPGISLDRAVARLSLEAQLLWHRIYQDAADDQGRFVADPRHVKITCVPYVDALLPEAVAACLRELVEVCLIILYDGNGELLGQCVHWWRDQTGAIAYPSDWPAPPGWRDSWRYRVRLSEGSQYDKEHWPPDRGQGAAYLRSRPTAVFLGTDWERSWELPSSSAGQGSADQVSAAQITADQEQDKAEQSSAAEAAAEAHQLLSDHSHGDRQAIEQALKRTAEFRANKNSDVAQVSENPGP